MKKCFFIIAIFCNAIIQNAIGQIELSGLVKSTSGKLLPYAIVSLKGTLLYAQSDDKGRYAIKGLRPDTCILEVQYLGFAKRSDTVVIGQENRNYDFILEENPNLMDEVIIESTRAGERTAMAYQTINKTELDKVNTGIDVPVMLNNATSVVSTSDAGAGIGYTGIRVRGSDATRINVTINGVPVNDAESHGVYWVNMPDLVSSTGSIQIQRGAGTSTNGAGAFGASLNMQTNTLRKDAFAEGIISGGSFNTLRTTFSAGTGLIRERWAFEGRASRITSDGFIDRASSKLHSWFLSGGYYGKNTTMKLIAFAGSEKTYQAWWGVPEAKLKGNQDSIYDYIENNFTYYDPFNAQDSANILYANNQTYNIYRYKNQTDNYKQDNYQFHLIHKFNDKLSFNGAFHYTYGRGYYEEYKRNQKLSKYGIANVITIIDSLHADTLRTSDLIRRKWLDNDFYGGIFSFNWFPSDQLNLNLGGGVNQYLGRHYGEVIWSRYAGNSEINHEYYRDTAKKNDANVYLKTAYSVSSDLVAFVDLQYRNVYYFIGKINRGYDTLIPARTFNFFNPKIGITWNPNRQSRLYLSYSRANKEPNRDDIIENINLKSPKHETLDDIELGYNHSLKKIRLGINFYYMNYKDQLILTGKLNDVGNPVRINVPSSYRSGVELEGLYAPNRFFDINANLTLSKNEIRNFDFLIMNYDTYSFDSLRYARTPIAFSPNIIASLMLTFHPVKDVDLSLVGKHVGKQYLDNTGAESKKLNPYTVFDLRLNYKIVTVKKSEIILNMMINNLFDQKYTSNGYTYGWNYGGRTYRYNHYFPQAGTHAYGGITVRF